MVLLQSTEGKGLCPWLRKESWARGSRRSHALVDALFTQVKGVPLAAFVGTLGWKCLKGEAEVLG